MDANTTPALDSEERRFVCGTRAVERVQRGTGTFYLVVCATCGARGSVRYDARSQACSAAVRLSDRGCRYCKAR